MIQFVENLNALGHWLFLHFGRISIEVAILAALVGAAILALRIKRPAIRYAFWCLVLIKPAIALLATSPVSLYWYLQPIPAPEPTPIVMPAAPPLVRPPMRRAVPAAPVMRPMWPPTAAPRPRPTPPPPPEPTAWETFNAYGVGCAVWLAGVFVLFVRLVVGFAYVGFLRQSSRRQKVGLLAEAVADLRRELKIRRRVRIAISYVAHGPVLAGIVRPTILIPNDLAEDLTAEQARLIVGHELAHVKRWDNLLLLIQRIIEVFFFFHPVIWLTGHLMRREAEAAADDKILSIGGRPADYADALARAAEVRIGLTRRVLVNTFAASESDHARRVRRILNGRVVKTSLAMGVVAACALIIIAIIGLPGPAERKPDAKPEGDKEMVSHIKTPEELATAVKREGGKVWIDGVPDGTFGISWDMLARAMQTLLAYRGEKADFDELLAYSGDAFNLCHGSNWQGVSYLCAPTNIVGNMAEAYGYEYETIHNGYPFETMEDLERPARLVITERVLDRIRAEIEAGRPPLVGGAEDHCGSWTLAVGYDREGPLLRHVGDHQPNRWTPIRGVAPGSTDEDFGHWNGRFRGTIRDGFVGGWQDNPAYLIKQKKAHTPTRRENVLAALARAVQLHRAPTTHIGWSGGVDYHFGRRAYEQWAAELHKLDFPADVEKALPDEAYDWYEMGNMDIQADQIVRGRSAAATFCEKAVEVLPGAKDHLLAAAQAYRQEAAIATGAFTVFLEGTDDQRVAWLSDEAKREGGVTAIAQMLEKDEQAVRHIQAALAAASAPAAAVVARPTEYGFRVDPMIWVDSADGLDAALVRRDVFGTPKEGDKAVIQAEIDRLLAEVGADTAYVISLFRALKLGCDRNRPEVRRAVAVYLDGRFADHADGDIVMVLLLAGDTSDVTRRGLQSWIDMSVKAPHFGADPAQPTRALETLLAGQDLADIRNAVRPWVDGIDEGLDEVACWNKMDPWGILGVIGRVNDPRARGIVERYIPILLRTQGADGGWGGRSLAVFRALTKYGLLDELRAKPPLPAEWRVARTIPSPEGSHHSLTWDGSRFWTLDPEAKQAIAISPEDGRELKRLDLDLKSPRGLGWYDGLLVVFSGGFMEDNDPARMVLIDVERDRVIKEMPFTADIWYPMGGVQIGRKLWTAQGCWVTSIDIATGECKGQPYRGAWARDLAYDGQGIWGIDNMMPALYRYDVQGRLLDFAEVPFFESISKITADLPERPVSGIACTDEGLWALSNSTGQIALLERIGPAFAAAPVAATATTADGARSMQAVVSTPVFDIPKLADMDASASPDQWGDRGLRVDVMTPFGPRKPMTEFGARFRLGWDETGLWLLATVTDDEFHSAESVEKLWANEADLILLYVIREEGEFLRIVIEPGMTADQPSPRTITDGGGNSLGVHVTREKTDGGYVLQAWAPWSEISIEPAEGKELRAQVIVLDVDGAGEDIQMGGALWFPAIGTPDNTSISHRLRLADRPSAPQVAVVEAADDRITITAAAEQVGKAVTVVEGDRTLAEATLAADDATGYAVASIPLPLPRLSSPVAQPTVMLDGQAIAALNPIQLSGYGMEQDTLSLAIEAAAKALGRDADFETIACLSSNAFAPMLSVGEDCTSWWMNEAWMADRCIETVARRVGLEIREIKLPEAEGTWDDKAAMAAHRRTIAPILREIMAGGEIIVISGGWQARQEHGFVPWGWAGIITEARDDGTILGVHPDNARTDNAIYVPGRLWALSPTEPTLSAHEADLIALQQAVNRIRGAERFQPDGPARYGLAAMDAYIEHMRTVPGFCAGCFERAPDRAWTDANDSARAVHGVAKTAASYLRRRIGTFKVEARPHIEAAVRHYDRIVLLLHPALTGEGGKSYQQWINGNLDAQKRHADTVLVPVRAQLAAAADAMARALAAEGVEVTAVPPTDLDDPIFALTEEFTAEQLTKLTAWSNLYGNLEIVLREAATNPEFLELFRQQLALGSLSGDAPLIRGFTGRLEPAEDAYLMHVEKIVRTIAAGEWGEDQPFFMPGREERLKMLRGILADWVDGVGLANAKSKATSKTETIAVQRIHGLLGEHTADKAEAVAGLVGKFSPDGDCDDKFYEWEAMKDKTTVAQTMAHHITMLDKPLWHLDYSLSVTLAGIGHGESIGDWRTPGGHLGWKNWINPKDLPRVKTIAAALEAWLAGGEADGEVAKIVAALGKRDAYREKAWLAGCLLHYLRTDSKRTDEFVEQLEADWLPLGPEGFTMDELTDSLVTGDISWYWPRPAE